MQNNKSTPCKRYQKMKRKESGECRAVYPVRPSHPHNNCSSYVWDSPDKVRDDSRSPVPYLASRKYVS